MNSIKLFLVLVIIIVLLHKTTNCHEDFMVQESAHKNKVKECCDKEKCYDKPEYQNKNCDQNKLIAKRTLDKQFKMLHPTKNCDIIESKPIENFEQKNPEIENIYKDLNNDNNIVTSNNKLVLSKIPDNFYIGINKRNIKKKLKAGNDGLKLYAPLN